MEAKELVLRPSFNRKGYLTPAQIKDRDILRSFGVHPTVFHESRKDAILLPVLSAGLTVSILKWFE